MKSAEPRSFADPEKAALKLLEIANATEAVQDGRIYIELLQLEGVTGRRRRGAQDGDPARAAGDARIGDLREVHASRRRIVCMKEAASWGGLLEAA